MGLSDWILSDSRYARMREVRRVEEMGAVRTKWAAKRGRDTATRTARVEVGVDGVRDGRFDLEKLRRFGEGDDATR